MYGSPENQPQAIPFNELVPSKFCIFKTLFQLNCIEIHLILNSFVKLVKRDCTSDITEKLKRVPGLRPKVLEDFQNTTQQFCFDGSFIVIFLRGVVSKIYLEFKNESRHLCYVIF